MFHMQSFKTGAAKTRLGTAANRPLPPGTETRRGAIDTMTTVWLIPETRDKVIPLECLSCMDISKEDIRLGSFVRTKRRQNVKQGLIYR